MWGWAIAPQCGDCISLPFSRKTVVSCMYGGEVVVVVELFLHLNTLLRFVLLWCVYVGICISDMASVWQLGGFALHIRWELTDFDRIIGYNKMLHISKCAWPHYLLFRSLSFGKFMSWKFAFPSQWNVCNGPVRRAIVMLPFILQTRKYTSGTYFPWDNTEYSTSTWWWRYKIQAYVISRHWNTISILLRYSRCANTAKWFCSWI